MLALRVIGALLAALFLVTSIARYQRRQISRLSLIIGGAISVAVFLLAVEPGWFDPLFETFNFEPGSGQRLTAVLLAAVVVLYLLLARLTAYVDTNERSIRLLVEALGQQNFDWERAAHIPEGKRIVVISPAYNEVENVGPVIHAMPAEVEGHRVIPILVDDCSDDGTADVARAAGALVSTLPIRRGGGLALRVGYGIALKLGADVIVSIDADGQHQPEELPILVKPILAGEADHVNGSRMLGDYERGPMIRQAGVHFFSWIVTLLTGQRVTDISSGYRATSAETLRKLILTQDQFWTSEVTIEALRQRARIVEVPVTFLTRRGGESKKPKSLRYAWNFSKAITKTWLR
ncbi:MAG TPA: glycosyltransferase family 2 protein [Actinomycetota bacterium]|nr:glycosyltransferase family 2 protein [Actinomycetota bacterium]